jgi:TrmH family RNA methyltransferase
MTLLARCDVCLVGTSNPENLGAVARLLENFGSPSLTLVAPRASVDDPRALVVGRAARERLPAARITDTLQAAVHHAAHVVGFSARRGSDRPTVGLRALPALLDERAPSGPLVLVFGPEDTGLVASDLVHCDLVTTIDTPGPLPSLNLAQAVGIALWELSQATTPAAPSRPVATRAELEALLDHVFAVLDAAGAPDDEEQLRKRVHLRRMLAAAALRPEDVRALHGLCVRVLSALLSAPGPR